MKKGKIIIYTICGVLVVLIAVTLLLIYIESQKRPVIHYQDVSEDGTFSTSFIRESHLTMNHKNYMISPYSVEIALSMLRDGANGKTQEELMEVVPERKIKTLIVQDRVNVANAVFVKDIYKKDVRDAYITILENNYNAQMIVDSFTTPDKINQWVDRETNGMIKKILDQMDPQFVIGLANAVAMEEAWQTPFVCEETKGYAFTQENGKQYDVAMMSHSFEENASYYQSEDAEAVVLPYIPYNRETGKPAEFGEEGEQLDFIGILPNDLDSYISSFTLDTIREIEENKKEASDLYEIYVGLPRFEYEYDFKKFKSTLRTMGIKSVFDSSSCDLSNMLDNHPDSYVSEAIHKSYVKVNEEGTKAAAVTYFGVKDMAMPIGDKEYVSIIFDRPFIYMIKDHESNEILFFGVVYEPEKWDESKSCK